MGGDGHRDELLSLGCSGWTRSNGMRRCTASSKPEQWWLTAKDAAPRRDTQAGQSRGSPTPEEQKGPGASAALRGEAQARATDKGLQGSWDRGGCQEPPRSGWPCAFPTARLRGPLSSPCAGTTQRLHLLQSPHATECQSSTCARVAAPCPPSAPARSAPPGRMWRGPVGSWPWPTAAHQGPRRRGRYELREMLAPLSETRSGLPPKTRRGGAQRMRNSCCRRGRAGSCSSGCRERWREKPAGLNLLLERQAIVSHFLSLLKSEKWSARVQHGTGASRRAQ